LTADGASRLVRLDDRLARIIGIPGFGITIPLLTGLYGELRPTDAAWWLGQALFVLLAGLIWEGNRWLLFKQREHLDWFGHPVRKLLTLLAACVLYTAPATAAVLALWAWFQPHVAGDAIRTVVLTNVICVIFVTHAYETVFLVRERAVDRVAIEALGRARLEAELSALRSHVDPHFLFNALNTLSWLVGTDPAAAKTCVEQLARVYRYVLAHRTAPLVPLEDELAFLAAYRWLVAQRFGERLRVAQDPLGSGRWLVPPVSLQVLLENAVKHNALDEPLDVTLALDDDALVVSNNRRPRRGVSAGPGTGLANLAERVRLTTGRVLEVDVTPERFTVRVPLVELGR
jgi:hypothetical protein